LDFVEGLLQSGHANYILVVDKLTKDNHFSPLRYPFTAASVAKLFLDQVYMFHGMPLAIVSDRDRVFTTKFWQELFRLADVQLRLSSAYHTQFDGQIERVNQCMESFHRCFVSACPKK
jgi:transposase InsO family protein